MSTPADASAEPAATSAAPHDAVRNDTVLDNTVLDNTVLDNTVPNDAAPDDVPNDVSPYDSAQALRAHATRVLQDAHFFHLILGLGALALVGLVLGPDRYRDRRIEFDFGLSAVQRGLLVGWLAGAINLSLLVWIGLRLMVGRLGDLADDSPAGRGTAAFAASIKLILLGLVLWLGWRVWAVDPAGLVIGVSLAPLALARVGLRLV